MNRQTLENLVAHLIAVPTVAALTIVTICLKTIAVFSVKFTKLLERRKEAEK